MAYFPVNINIENKKCFVIGGGTVAKRKANMLLDFGADVTVVAEELKQDFEGCKVLKKPFEYDDIKSAFFALRLASSVDIAYLRLLLIISV